MFYNGVSKIILTIEIMLISKMITVIEVIMLISNKEVVTKFNKIRHLFVEMLIIRKVGNQIKDLKFFMKRGVFLWHLFYLCFPIGILTMMKRNFLHKFNNSKKWRIMTDITLFVIYALKEFYIFCIWNSNNDNILVIRSLQSIITLAYQLICKYLFFALILNIIIFCLRKLLFVFLNVILRYLCTIISIKKI